MRSRFIIERIGLFLLGIAAIFVGAASSLGLWFVIAALVAAAVIAGLVEVAATRRTGRRHWVWSWLPCVLGMVALAAEQIATGPQGPDSGLALSIVVFGFIVITPLFALVVNIVAAVGLRLRPAAVSDTGP